MTRPKHVFVAAFVVLVAGAGCKHVDYFYRHDVSGKVVDPSGTPLANATVMRVERPGDDKAAGVEGLYERVTGSDGAFRFEYSGLGREPEPHMTWHLAVTHAGFGRRDVTVQIPWQKPAGGGGGYVKEGIVLALEAARSIGSAKMEADGTIVLMLRAETGGAIGDALFRYPPGHEKYDEVLKHLGGLKPGEEKPVPPWP